MDYCDFGFEMEMPVWLFALLMLVFIAFIVLWFIATIKSIKAYRERTNKNKPKEDELQKLLNVVNDRIIRLHEAKKGKEDQTFSIMRGDFESFKYMILALIKDREEQNDARKR